MSVKSIKIKIFIPSDQQAVRGAIGATHRIHNLGSRRFMEHLLDLRQDDVYDDPESQTPKWRKAELQRRLLKTARAAQKRNIDKQTASDQEVLDLLRQVYEQLVPAALGKPGDNQAIARDWLGSLVSKESQARLNLKPEMNDRKKRDVRFRRKLKRAGLLPLWPMVRLEFADEWMREDDKGRIKPFDLDNVTGWERDMFQQALERISSWESWNLNARERHSKAQSELAEWEQEHKARLEIVRPILQRYEKSRGEDLEAAALGITRPFRIKRRMLRNWDRIREKWEGKTEAEHLLELAAKYQRSHPREVGDMDLIRFLAKKENHAVWAGDYDYVRLHLWFNQLLTHSEECHSYTTMTLPDPICHPLWARFDVPQGTNMNDYGLVQNQGRWSAKFDLLFPEGKKLVQRRVSLPIAASGQLAALRPVDGSSRDLIFTDPGAQEEFKARWGQARLQFDRELLERAQEKGLSAGSFGPVYLNLALDIEDNKALPTRPFKRFRDGVEWFISGLKKAAELEDKAYRDLGCLSIDLGIRQLGACSVFRLREGRAAASEFSIPVAGVPALRMTHERSFLLDLPGERCSRAALKQRRNLWDELYKLAHSLRQLNDLIRISGQEGKARKEALEILLQDAEPSVFDLRSPDELQKQIGLPPQSWQKCVTAMHRKWEGVFSDQLKQWRRSASRTKDGASRHQGLWGLSLPGIEYLERIRRLLIRWTTHSREAEKIKRLEKDRIFAGQLQKHINKLKEDRIKKSADAIVGTARKQSCRLILFEDLGRYRFRTDRPRHENRTLMRWAHRELVRETARQAQPFGISIALAGAGFSSRYHARTGAPGVRCKPLSKEDLEDTQFLTALKEEGLDTARLREGDLVRWMGGELFATVVGGKRLSMHADINAAQNLQRRFWTDYAEPFRIVCGASQGEPGWLPILGARNKAFFGRRFLAPLNGDGVCELRDASKPKRTIAAQESDPALEEADHRPSEEEEALLKRRRIFFRDPSSELLPRNRWYSSEIFWQQVQAKVQGVLSCR